MSLNYFVTLIMFLFFLQLVFTDEINKRVYVTLDEGDTFIHVDLSFVPNTIIFQKSWVSNVSQYENHILGYYGEKQEVRQTNERTDEQIERRRRGEEGGGGGRREGRGEKEGHNLVSLFLYNSHTEDVQ